MINTSALSDIPIFIYVCLINFYSFSDKHISFNGTHKVGAFVPHKEAEQNGGPKMGAFVTKKESDHNKSEEDIPFLSLLQYEKVTVPVWQMICKCISGKNYKYHHIHYSVSLLGVITGTNFEHHGTGTNEYFF